MSLLENENHCKAKQNYWKYGKTQKLWFLIEDIAFELFAMHCAIGRVDKTKENLTGKKIMS